MIKVTDGQLPRLTGCSVLPPMDPQSASTPKLSTKNKPKGPKHKSTGDRFSTINVFVDFTLGDLKRNEIAVWLLLWRDERDGLSRTSMADMARRLKIDRRTAIRAVGQLQKRGLLQVVFKGSLNQGPSTYRVKPLEPTSPTGDKAVSG